MTTTARELYPAALRATIRLLDGFDASRGQPPDSADPFRQALMDWEARRGAEAHIRQYGGMGSLNDWELAYWDDETGSYEADIWPAACFNSFRSAVLGAGTMIVAGESDAPVPEERKPLRHFGESHERCLGCGYEFARRSEAESLAAFLWQRLVVAPAVADGAFDEAIEQALSGSSHPVPRRFVREVEDEFSRAGIAIVENAFRRPVFEEFDETDPTAFDRPARVIAGDDSCPRCSSNTWGQHWWLVTAPPLLLSEGMNPFELADAIEQGLLDDLDRGGP